MDDTTVTPDPEAVARSWREVLGGAAEHSVDESAAGFISAGGNSLRAARLAGLIRRRWGVEVPLSLLLRNATLAELQEYVYGTPRANDGAPRDHDSLMVAADTSPLAPEQRRIWLLGRLHSNSSAYNVIAAVRLRGNLDVPALKRAMRWLVGRHDVLRAHITRNDDGEPEWSYRRQGTLPVEIRRLPGPLAQDRVDEFVNERARTVIPDDSAPLARAALLCSAAADDACLVIVLNHLIADQTAADLLLAELAAGYSTERRGEQPDLPPAPAYSGYARVAAGRTASPQHRADLEYWRTTLTGVPAELWLPFRRRRPSVPVFRGEASSRRLGQEVGDRLDLLLRDRGLTPMSFHLACVGAVLAAWSGQDDIVLGVPVSRRRSPLEQRLAGFLLDTLPLRLAVGTDVTLCDLAAQAQERYGDAVAHSTPTFDTIVRHLETPTRPDRNPLFQVWVNDLTQMMQVPEFAGLHAAPHQQSMTAALFDLGWYIWRDAEGYRIELVRDTELFTAEAADELLDQVHQVVMQAIDDPGRSLAALRLAGGGPMGKLADPDPVGAEVDGVPAGAGAPRGDVGDEVLVRFNAVAEERGDATAVVAGDERLSYRDLRAHVRRTVAVLAENGVSPGTLVELRAQRSATYPGALLGAWAHGVCPVLLDAEAPPERLRAYRRTVRPGGVLILTDQCTPGTDPVEVERLPAAEHGWPSDDLSHVLLTSGSAGRPLAVRVPRGPLENFLAWYEGRFTPRAADRFALLAGAGHDPVLRDILVPLLAGAELHVPPRDVFGDPVVLADWFGRSGITVAHVTPALLEILCAGQEQAAAGGSRCWKTLRLVVSAGAPLTAGLARRFRGLSDAVLVNAYGTTETPQIAACQVVDESVLPGEPDEADQQAGSGEPLPIGRGVAANQVLVLTPAGELAAPGQRGEIVVRSRHLATGYLDEVAPDQAARFWTDPADGPGVRRFHTGDLGYFDLAGRIVVTGRADRQVSIDGFRLELGEVERAAVSHPRVRGAVAVLRSTPAGGTLTLQVSTDHRAPVTEESLRARLSAALPSYAVPAVIEFVDRVSLTENHKPRPSGAVRRPPETVATGRAGPVGLAALAALAALAEQIVGRPLDPDANLFEAGMTSLLLVRFHERVLREQELDFPITVLFTCVSLRALAEYIEHGPNAVEQVVPTVDPGNGVAHGLNGTAAARRELRDRIRRAI